jgi:hypothetical protein
MLHSHSRGGMTWVCPHLSCPGAAYTQAPPLVILNGGPAAGRFRDVQASNPFSTTRAVAALPTTHLDINAPVQVLIARERPTSLLNQAHQVTSMFCIDLHRSTHALRVKMLSITLSITPSFLLKDVRQRQRRTSTRGFRCSSGRVNCTIALKSSSSFKRACGGMRYGHSMKKSAVEDVQASLSLSIHLRSLPHEVGQRQDACAHCLHVFYPQLTCARRTQA